MLALSESSPPFTPRPKLTHTSPSHCSTTRCNGRGGGGSPAAQQRALRERQAVAAQVEVGHAELVEALLGAHVLADKPVGLIWGVGKVFQQKLERDGIRTIGQLQEMEK